MQITIDTNNLSELDIAMLAFLADQGETAEQEDPSPAPVETAKPKTATKTKAAAVAEDLPEAVAASSEPEDEDLVGGSAPTMSDAIAAATELVSNGGAAKVKKALAAVNVKKVSELPEEDIAKFLEALAAAE